MDVALPPNPSQQAAWARSLPPELMPGIAHYMDSLADICSLLCSSKALHSLRYEIVADWVRRQHGADQSVLAVLTSAKRAISAIDNTPSWLDLRRTTQLVQQLLRYPNTNLSAVDSQQQTPLHIA